MSQSWDEPAPVDKRGFKPLTVAGDLSEGLRRIRLARLCERAGDYTAKKNLVNGYWERVLGARTGSAYWERSQYWIGLIGREDRQPQEPMATG